MQTTAFNFAAYAIPYGDDRFNSMVSSDTGFVNALMHL